jgi:hypothetical protein
MGEANCTKAWNLKGIRVGSGTLYPCFRHIVLGWIEVHNINTQSNKHYVNKPRDHHPDRSEISCGRYSSYIINKWYTLNVVFIKMYHMYLNKT